MKKEKKKFEKREKEKIKESKGAFLLFSYFLLFKLQEILYMLISTFKISQEYYKSLILIIFSLSFQHITIVIS